MRKLIFPLTIASEESMAHKYGKCPFTYSSMFTQERRLGACLCWTHLFHLIHMSSAPMLIHFHVFPLHCVAGCCGAFRRERGIWATVGQHYVVANTQPNTDPKDACVCTCVHHRAWGVGSLPCRFAPIRRVFVWSIISRGRVAV